MADNQELSYQLHTLAPSRSPARNRKSLGESARAERQALGLQVDGKNPLSGYRVIIRSAVRVILRKAH